MNLTGAQVAGGTKSLLTGSGGLLLPQLTQGQLRQPAVMTTTPTPVKVAGLQEGKKEVGESGKRDKEPGASPPKRIRLTRKSAGGNTEQSSQSSD